MLYRHQVKYACAFVVLLFMQCSINLFAQGGWDSLKEYVAQDLRGIRNNDLQEIKEFYADIQFRTAWTQAADRENLNILIKDIERSAFLGLNPDDYNLDYIKSFLSGKTLLNNIHDSVVTDVAITSLAIHFYTDILHGNREPDFRYNGLGKPANCIKISQSLSHYLLNGHFNTYLENISSSIAEINIITSKISRLITIMSEKGFEETLIKSKSVNASNRALVTKLYQLGLLDTVYENIPDTALKQKVKQAQLLFDLSTDGTLSKATLTDLNIPLSKRLQQLQVAVNYYRWLTCFAKDQSIIVVNIPAAYLKVYRNNSVLLEMRMVVGKQSTPTPTLTSFVNEIVLYPYWHVPYSIATKELLPIIKKDVSFLNTGNYQVLNMSGKIMNPYAINWHALSSSYFPYVIRQSTGCDNSLGLIKLSFDSPFGVYLHDTPVKIVFASNRRFFSHGCMRMEKPMELGRMILKDNAIAIDTLEQKGCLLNQSPISVPAKDRMPVIVWYNTVGTDSTGHVIFFHDIYNKLR